MAPFHKALAALPLAATSFIAAALAQPAPTPPLAPPTEPSTPPQVAPVPRQPGPFDDRVLEIARTFREFSRVSDRANWAPTLCNPPAPAGALKSASTDSSTHGRKLYFLFAKDAGDYQSSGNHSPGVTAKPPAPFKAAVGQALVKQSFVPVPVPADQPPTPPADNPEHRGTPPEFAFQNGKFYRTGDPGALFIMFKIDPATPDTDEGWVYAATTPDGKTILEAGRIESCMECHTQTTRDRLYGPQWSWPEDPVSKKSVPPTRENVERIRKLREGMKVNAPVPETAPQPK